MVAGRAVGIDVPIKLVNLGLWDRLAKGAHEYGMTVDEYCDFLLARENDLALLRSISRKKLKGKNQPTNQIK